MQPLVRFAQALADPTRVRIVQLLTSEALCVCELAGILGMPQSSVSSHLQIIRKAGLLTSERCEKWIYYRLEVRYRSLLATLLRFFEVTPASDATMQSDLAAARRRLVEREESCCPRPKTLRSRRALATAS